MEIFLAKNIISDVSNELWACLLYFIYTGCSSPAQHRLVGRTSVRTRGGCQQIRAISRAFLRTSEIPPPRMPSFLPPFPIPRPLPRPGPRPLLKYISMSVVSLLCKASQRMQRMFALFICTLYLESILSNFHKKILSTSKACFRKLFTLSLFVCA